MVRQKRRHKNKPKPFNFPGLGKEKKQLERRRLDALRLKAEIQNGQKITIRCFSLDLGLRPRSDGQISPDATGKHFIVSFKEPVKVQDVEQKIRGAFGYDDRIR